jgi:hypothetical protein
VESLSKLKERKIEKIQELMKEEVKAIQASPDPQELAARIPKSIQGSDSQEIIIENKKIVTKELDMTA